MAVVLGCGDDFVGPCVPDDAGQGCDDGGSSPDGGGSAGMNSGTSGTGSTNPDGGPGADTGTDPTEDDAGEMPPTEMDAAAPMDATTSMDAAQPTPDSGQDPNLPPADGTQLAPCDVFDENSCDEGLRCYVRGNGPGYCSAECEDDEDCEALTDAEYTCSTTFSGGGQGPGGGTGICRVECDDEDDTESCPGSLVCLRVTGGGQGNGGAFRCGYPAEPPGGGEDGTVARFGRCESSDDCMGDLVCYGAFGGFTGGFCTDACESNDDCTEDPGSGDIDPTCGSQNLCRFDCAEGGTCPDGMECTSDRCIYPEQ